MLVTKQRLTLVVKLDKHKFLLMLILGNYIRSLRLLLILHRLVLTLAENIEDQLIFDDKLKGYLEKMINISKMMLQ